MDTSEKISNKNDEHLQGSQAWLVARSKRITSSDAPSIMSVSAYGPKSLYDLWAHKVGLKSQAVTPAMRKGSEIEPIERNRLSIELGVSFDPTVVIDDWRMTSLDGISPDGTVILEIKSCQKQTLYDIMDGKIPKHYYAQIQHHLSMVPEATHCILAAVCDDQRMQADVLRDDAYIKDLVAKERAFYSDYLSTMVPPPGGNETVEVITDSDLATLEKEYLHLKRKKEKAEEDIALIIQAIKIKIGDRKKSCGMFLTFSQSERGGYDYSRACKEANIDMEKYKKPVSPVFTIREIDEGNENNIAMENV